MKTKEKIIHECCKPYGGFVNVITKCGGTLVSQLWNKSMEIYAAQFQKDDRAAKTATEFAEFILTTDNIWRIHAPSDPQKNYRYMIKFRGKEPSEVSATELYTLWQQSLPPESDQII